MFFKDVEYFTHTLFKISPKMHILESGIILLQLSTGVFSYIQLLLWQVEVLKNCLRHI